MSEADQPPNDSTKPVVKGCEKAGRISKGEFSRKLEGLTVVHGTTETFKHSLLDLMHKSFGDVIELPVKAEPNKAGVYASTAEQYSKSDHRDTKIDVCRYGCMAFHGLGHIEGNTDKVVDLSKQLYCLNTKCRAQRFSKCRVCPPERPYEDCCPWKRDGHGEVYRKPLDTVYYRSVMGKIIELYLLSISDPEFKDVLNYDKMRIKSEGTLIDILDGRVVKTHLQEMNEAYLKRKSGYRVDGVPTELHECSLGLTMFYDGKTNFKRNSDSMWPLLVQIINCNPSLRSRLGVGMFLAFLHNATVGSGAEKHLMEEMFCMELKALEEGFIFQVNLPDGSIRHVFLQARLLFAHLDTKAVEKVAGCKCTGSKFCSFCNSLHGHSDPVLGKMIYPRWRENLHPRHWLRFYGEVHLGDEAEERAFHTYSEYYRKYRSQRAAKVTLKPMGHILTAEERLRLEKLPVIKKQLPSAPPRVWENPHFPMWMFQDKLRFHTTDFSAQNKHRRTTQAEYEHHGATAKETLRQYVEFLRRNNREWPKTPKDCSSHGIHAVCALSKHLKSFPFECFGFDWMHLISNVGWYQLAIARQLRGLDDKSRKLSAGLSKLPDLEFRGILPSFCATEKGTAAVDAVMNTVLIPPLHRAEHNIKNPMVHLGWVKAKQHNTFLTTYASYCFSYSGMAQEYVNYAARYGHDMCRILNPCVRVEDLESIIASVFETMAIKEGLFPESELVFIYHEIVDIMHHLIDFGNVRGMMCFSGERALSTIASCVTKGGVHYLKSLYYRYIKKEELLKTDIKVNPDFIDNNGIYSDFALKLHGEGRSFPFSDNSHNALYSSLNEFLDAQRSDRIFATSPFYRLYKAYDYSMLRFDRSAQWRAKCSGFFTWIKLIASLYAPGDERDREITAEIGKFRGIIAVLGGDPGATPSMGLSGTFFFKDFLALKDSICSFVPVAHRRALIKGVAFNLRGISAMERDLEGTWSSKHQSACWMRFTQEQVIYQWPEMASQAQKRQRTEGAPPASTSRHPTFVTRNQKTVLGQPPNSVVSFGQGNCVFRIDMPQDCVVGGLVFVSVSVRPTTYHGKKFHYAVDDVKRAPGIRFVCAHDIDSTAVGIHGVDSEGRFMSRPDARQGFYNSKVVADPHQVYAAVSDTPALLKRLYLLELHPERLSLKYNASLGCNLLNRNDTVKLWDKAADRALAGQKCLLDAEMKC